MQRVTPRFLHSKGFRLFLLLSLLILLTAGLVITIVYNIIKLGPEPGDFNSTVTSANINNFKASLIYTVTWDNYCLNPRVKIVNLKTHKKFAIQNDVIKGYEGPCGHGRPASYWLQTGDYNHDGYTDFAVLSGNDFADKSTYSQFMFDPANIATVPFKHE